jgi:hypothetical protein
MGSTSKLSGFGLWIRLKDMLLELLLGGFLKVIEWAGKGFVPFLMLFM